MRKLKKYKPTKFKAKDSHYDVDAADYAVNFIECLCHTKGTWDAVHAQAAELDELINEFNEATGLLKAL